MVRNYGHPFAAFNWKALIALYERDVPFEFLMIDAEHPKNAEGRARAKAFKPLNGPLPASENH